MFLKESHIDAKDRIYFYDNAKFLLILSVALVHFWSKYRHSYDYNTQNMVNNLTNNAFTKTACGFIHMYIMSGFFIISGFFASHEISYKKVAHLVTFLIIPYFLLDTLAEFMFPDSKNNTLLLLEPFYILWFVGVLIIYRILTPYLQYIRLSFLFFFLFVVTLGAHLGMRELEWGAWDGIKFAPFYLLGYWLQQKNYIMSNIPSTKTRFLGLMGSALIIYGIYYFNLNYSEYTTDAGDAGVLSGVPYLIKKYEFPLSFIRDIILRILMVVSAFCILSLVPKRKTFFTNWGKNSLYAYLLHVFFIPVLEKGFGIYKFDNPIYIVFLFFAALVVISLLSSQFLAKIIEKLLNFIGKFLLKN